jgi:hypothetical protein
VPHFFFHLQTSDGRELDEIGLSLPSVEAAYLEACASIPGITSESACRRQNLASFAFEITDDSGVLSAAAATAIVLVVDTKQRPGAKQVAAKLMEVALVCAMAIAALLYPAAG